MVYTMLIGVNMMIRWKIFKKIYYPKFKWNGKENIINREMILRSDLEIQKDLQKKMDILF